MSDENALPGLAPVLNGIDHAKPMILSLPKGEQRAMEYPKAARRGNWYEVLESFDKRQKAKAGPSATDALDEGAEMFGDVRVAAE